MKASLDPTAPIAWARPYAKAVAGHTINFSFNSSSHVATLVYTINPTCSQPTIIFVSSMWIYTTGLEVVVFPDTAASWAMEGPDHIAILHTAPIRGLNITVHITPK